MTSKKYIWFFFIFYYYLEDKAKSKAGEGKNFYSYKNVSDNRNQLVLWMFHNIDYKQLKMYYVSLSN